MKIKLSPKQQANLKNAIAREQQTGASFRTAQAAAAEAANHRAAILEMIFETHNVDLPAPDVRINLSDDGTLTFGEQGKASKRIREAVKRGAKVPAKKAAGKVVPFKTK